MYKANIEGVPSFDVFNVDKKINLILSISLFSGSHHKSKPLKGERFYFDVWLIDLATSAKGCNHNLSALKSALTGVTNLIFSFWSKK